MVATMNVVILLLLALGLALCSRTPARYVFPVLDCQSLRAESCLRALSHNERLLCARESPGPRHELFLWP